MSAALGAFSCDFHFARPRISLLLSQGLHSGITFAITVYFTHTLESGDFAYSTVAFLFSTLVSTAVGQWIAQLFYARAVSPRAAIEVSAIMALGAIAIHLIYASLIMPPRMHLMLLVPAAILSSVTFGGLRRYFLIEGLLQKLFCLELARAGLTVLVLALVQFDSLTDSGLLIWMIVAHLPGLLLLLRSPGGPDRLRPYEVVGSSGRAAIAADQLNSILGQGAIVLAPIFIGAELFAAARAFEIFFVFFGIFAQAFEAHYSRKFRAVVDGGGSITIWTVAQAALILASPSFGLMLWESVMPRNSSVLALLIPEKYQYASFLFWIVLSVAILSAIAATLRWYMQASGKGVGVLVVTVTAAFASWLLFAFGAGLVSMVALPIVAKGVYEAICTVALLPSMLFGKIDDRVRAAN